MHSLEQEVDILCVLVAQVCRITRLISSTYLLDTDAIEETRCISELYYNMNSTLLLKVLSFNNCFTHLFARSIIISSGQTITTHRP